MSPEQNSPGWSPEFRSSIPEALPPLLFENPGALADLDPWSVMGETAQAIRRMSDPTVLEEEKKRLRESLLPSEGGLPMSEPLFLWSVSSEIAFATTALQRGKEDVFLQNFSLTQFFLAELCELVYGTGDNVKLDEWPDFFITLEKIVAAVTMAQSQRLAKEDFSKFYGLVKQQYEPVRAAVSAEFTAENKQAIVNEAIKLYQDLVPPGQKPEESLLRNFTKVFSETPEYLVAHQNERKQTEEQLSAQLGKISFGEFMAHYHQQADQLLPELARLYAWGLAKFEETNRPKVEQLEKDLGVGLSDQELYFLLFELKRLKLGINLSRWTAVSRENSVDYRFIEERQAEVTSILEEDNPAKTPEGAKPWQTVKDQLKRAGFSAAEIEALEAKVTQAIVAQETNATLAALKMLQGEDPKKIIIQLLPLDQAGKFIESLRGEDYTAEDRLHAGLLLAQQFTGYSRLPLEKRLAFLQAEVIGQMAETDPRRAALAEWFNGQVDVFTKLRRDRDEVWPKLARLATVGERYTPTVRTLRNRRIPLKIDDLYLMDENSPGYWFDSLTEGEKKELFDRWPQLENLIAFESESPGAIDFLRQKGLPPNIVEGLTFLQEKGRKTARLR